MTKQKLIVSLGFVVLVLGVMEEVGPEVGVHPHVVERVQQVEVGLRVLRRALLRRLR